MEISRPEAVPFILLLDDGTPKKDRMVSAELVCIQFYIRICYRIHDIRGMYSKQAG